MPLPGIDLRTIARARTSRVGKSKTRSSIDPLLAGFSVRRNSPPRPTFSARAVLVWTADLHPTHMPFGARMRGCFRRFTRSAAMIAGYFSLGV